MVLDATAAGASANSYLTVADADALAADDLGRAAAKWLEADAATKEKALIRATREIEAAFGATIRYSTTQTRNFPRGTDWTGSPAVPYLPDELKHAQYEQAIYVLANANDLDEAATRRARGLFSFSDQDVSGTLFVDPAQGRIAPEAAFFLTALRAVGGISLRPLVAVPIGRVDEEGLHW